MLEDFQPRTRVMGDKIDLRQNEWYNKPYLFQVVEHTDQFKQKMKQGETTEAIWCDVVDLTTNRILINVLFTNGAIVDNLKDKAGRDIVVPARIVKVAGGNFGGYASLEALQPNEKQYADQWYATNWPMVAQTRAAKEAQAKPLGNFAPQGQLQANPAGVQSFQPQAQPGQPDPMFSGQSPQSFQPSPNGQDPAYAAFLAQQQAQAAPAQPVQDPAYAAFLAAQQAAAAPAQPVQDPAYAAFLAAQAATAQPQGQGQPSQADAQAAIAALNQGIGI